MLSKVSMAFLFCCIMVFTSQGQETRNDDSGPLEGKWKAVAYTEDGEVAARLEKTPIDWEFKKNQLIITTQDQQVCTLKGTFKVDKTTDPKAIDLKIEKQDDIPVQNMKGIYQVEKGKLTICYTVEGKRPKAFESQQGSNSVLIVFERK